jgi:hypothetical protein
MRWFQAASCVLIALALVHSMSFLTSPPPPANDTEAKLQGLMKTYKSDLMGVPRSMQELFTGFLISFSVFSLTLGAAGLAVARGGDRAVVRRLAAAFGLGLAVMTAVSVGWWFHAPTGFLAAATLCYAIAWLKLA